MEKRESESKTAVATKSENGKRREYRAGEFEKIQDDYEDKKEEARAKEVSMKKGQELTYEEKRILGYIPKETS